VNEEKVRKEEVMFEMFRKKENEIMKIGMLMYDIRSKGIRRNDKSLVEMMENMRNVKKRSGKEGG
jgi:hypothetical protein